jgi:hypothetical protein
MQLLFSAFFQCHPNHSWRNQRIAAYPVTTATRFSPRILIAFMKLVQTLDIAKVIKRHASSLYSLSALIKDGSSCVHIRHLQT